MIFLRRIAPYQIGLPLSAASIGFTDENLRGRGNQRTQWIPGVVSIAYVLLKPNFSLSPRRVIVASVARVRTLVSSDSAHCVRTIQIRVHWLYIGSSLLFLLPSTRLLLSPPSNPLLPLAFLSFSVLLFRVPFGDIQGRA